MRIFLCIILFVSFFTACKTTSKTNIIPLSASKHIVFLDSLQATQAVISDKTEHFFDKIMPLEMMIQMKKSYPSTSGRNVILNDYLTYLKEDIESFTEDEKSFVTDIMKEAFEMCNTVSPKIFPQEIKLIKTKGRYYGESVFFTRENCIIIPAPELAAANKDQFLETMLHEVSHIYTRLKSAKKSALYELIGFKSLNNPQFIMNDSLLQRILYNPDGIDYAVAIDLKSPEGKAIKAIPIIYADEFSVTNPQKDFFQYLKFSLFQIEKKDDHNYKIISTPEGNSTIDLQKQPDFFKKITDNTNYIIHPDEIIADNFMYIMMRENGKSERKYSRDGDNLLKNMKMILQN